jgi:hypothetical protein
MMFDLADIVDNDADSDAEENDPAFGSDVERNAVLRQRIQKAALAKERALSLFQHVDQEEEESNVSYFYSVTILKSKITVFLPVICLIRVMWRVFSVSVQHIELHVRCAAQPCSTCLLSP